MTTNAAGAIQFDRKSGKGLRDGVISEGTFYFDVKSGHESALRAAVQRWADNLRKAPLEETIKSGLRDSRHIIFDGGRQMIWLTTFENDWDRYVEDALLLMGIVKLVDWFRHTHQFEALDSWMHSVGGTVALQSARGVYEFDSIREKAVRASAVGLKAILQSAQLPAASYFNALSYLTHPQIRTASQVNQAFHAVLDDPRATDALENPALQPLLGQAAE